MAPATTQVVKLNVGGRRFDTTVGTLMRLPSMFSGMLQTELEHSRDQEGAIFIDRDPEHFRHVLNFLRDGRIDVSSELEVLLALRKEADFYVIQELVEACDHAIAAMRRKRTVRLNIGGTCFETTTAMLDRCDPEILKRATIADDEVFVDRDGRHFHYVLEFLRHGITALPRNETQLKAVQREADYYKIKDLKKACNFILSNFYTIDNNSKLCSLLHSESRVVIFTKGYKPRKGEADFNDLWNIFVVNKTFGNGVKFGVYTAGKRRPGHAVRFYKYGMFFDELKSFSVKQFRSSLGYLLA